MNSEIVSGLYHFTDNNRTFSGSPPAVVTPVIPFDCTYTVAGETATRRFNGRTNSTTAFPCNMNSLHSVAGVTINDSPAEWGQLYVNVDISALGYVDTCPATFSGSPLAKPPILNVLEFIAAGGHADIVPREISGATTEWNDDYIISPDVIQYTADPDNELAATLWHKSTLPAVVTLLVTAEHGGLDTVPYELFWSPTYRPHAPDDVGTSHPLRTSRLMSWI